MRFLFRRGAFGPHWLQNLSLFMQFNVHQINDVTNSTVAVLPTLISSLSIDNSTVLTYQLHFAAPTTSKLVETLVNQRI